MNKKCVSDIEPIGIITGTGVSELLKIEQEEILSIRTSAGDAIVKSGFLAERPVVILERHGQGHAIPPHKINYPANLLALKELGVVRCLATAAVGSLRRDWLPGTLGVISDFISISCGGVPTLYDNKICHTDFSEPFCASLRETILKTGEDLGHKLEQEVVYINSDGPRYETPAEVRLFRMWGGDVVGMTVGKEAIIAREAGICYAAIAVVANLGSGLGQSALNHEEVEQAMGNAISTIAAIFTGSLEVLPAGNNC
ncbi:MAG: MTAP family purine nucleoside phosphorylase [bacterium]|jgi:5'-methylthioadenosine phosphorylase